MAAAISEFLEAIDSYMAKSAKGGDKFLASKLSAVFDNPKSPFSTARGSVLNVLSEKMNKLANQIEHITDNTEVFKYLNDGVRDLVVDTNVLRDRMKKSRDELDKFIKNIGGSIQNISIPAVTQQASAPVAAGVAFTGEVSISRIDRAVWQEAVPIVLEAWDKYRKSKPAEEVSIWRKFINIFSKPKEDIFGEQRNRQSNNIREGKPDKSRINILQTKTESQEKSGFWSTMFGWMSKILLVVGGIAGLGKLGDWIKTSPVGQAVMNVTKSIFGGIVNRIEDYFMGKQGEEKSMFHQHFDSMWNNILKPIRDFIQSGLEKGFTKTFSNENISWFFVDVLWGKIMKPLFTSMVEDWDKGEYGQLVMKSLGLLLIANKTGMLPLLGGILSLTGGLLSLGKGIFSLLPSLKSIGGAFSGLSGGLSNLKSLINPWTISTVAIGGTLIWAMHEMDKAKAEMSTAINETLASLDLQHKLLNEQNKKSLARIKEIQGKDILSRTAEESTDLSIEQDLIKRRALVKQFNDRSVKVEQKYNDRGFFGSVYDYWTSAREKELAALEKERFNQVSVLDDTIRRAKENLPAKKIQETTRNAEVEKAAKEAADIIWQQRNKRKVNDAIIVEPHSKDQVLAAKSDGPIDQALKHMVATLEEEVVLLRQGFAALIQATTNGSNTVASAVAASTSVPGTTGGYDPIGDKRQYYRRVIDGK